MKKYLYLCLVLITACKKDDDTPKPVIETISEFELDYGSTGSDRARHACITPLNHVLVVGSFQTTSNYTDFYLVEIDINGNFIREKTFGNDLDDDATAVIVGNDNNYLIGGNTITSTGTKDILLIKTNTEGDIIWQKTYGGISNEEVNHILPVDGTGYLLTGLTESIGAGSRDIILIRIDENGNEVWTKTYGGTNQEGGNQLVSTPDGNYMLFGFTQSYGAGDRDFYLLKINPQGDTIWTKTYGSPAYEETQEFIKLKTGGYLLLGHSAGVEINHDLYGIRINEDGDVTWAEVYGGNAEDGGEGILQDDDGSILMVGATKSFGNGEQVYLVKTNLDGNIISENNFGPSADDAGYHILKTPLSYIIIGETTKNGNYQLLVKKIAK